MGFELDPDGTEFKALLRMADFEAARVLEIGIGDGRLTMRYAGEAASVVGIEPKEDDIRKALVTCRADRRCEVNFVQAKAEALPFCGNAFDIAILAWSL